MLSLVVHKTIVFVQFDSVHLPMLVHWDVETRFGPRNKMHSVAHSNVGIPKTSGTGPRLLPNQRGLIGWCWEWLCPLLSFAFDSSQLPRIFDRFFFH